MSRPVLCNQEYEMLISILTKEDEEVERRGQGDEYVQRQNNKNNIFSKNLLLLLSESSSNFST